MLYKCYSLSFLLVMLTTIAQAQSDTSQKKLNITGTMGVSYEHYGLSRKPTGWSGFLPRRPWNQVRFSFQPTITTPKWSLPFNFNFNTTPTNVIGPYAGISKQSFSQYITNPANNFSFNPRYKWAELQLGTQYLNYSNLSTGDIGVFGAGFDLRPGIWRAKFFTGLSQQGINFFSNNTLGSYKRSNWMAQLGIEKNDKYALLLNFAKGKDDKNSITPPPPVPPPTILPQEGFTMSVVGKLQIANGWYSQCEAAQSYYTKDLNAPPGPNPKTLSPFFKTANASTNKDYALEGTLGKKSKNFDIGLKIKYLGAGFQTVGYPFLQPDRIDYTLNTRFNAFKNSTNVTASIGKRTNNVSNTALKADQLIANMNWFSQINDKWSVNINYNNFGFQSNSGLNPYGIKNVSNDFGITPTYTWTTKRLVNILSLSYNYSQYDERDVITGIITSNNTHMALLTYVPTFLDKKISPDFSIMYFNNKQPGFSTRIFSVNTGLAMPTLHNKLQLRGQLQFQHMKSTTTTADNNLIASCNIDAAMSKKLTWTNYICTNHYRYGTSSTPAGARYLESTIRTGLNYKLGK